MYFGLLRQMYRSEKTWRANAEKFPSSFCGPCTENQKDDRDFDTAALKEVPAPRKVINL